VECSSQKRSAVAVAREVASQPGRTRIAAQLQATVAGLQRIHVGLHRCRQVDAVPQAGDAVEVFAGLFRFVGVDGIEAGPGMGVEQQPGLVLGIQVPQDTGSE
jgi:hypothetical protein